MSDMSLSSAMLKIYQDLDAVAEKQCNAAGGISCKKGCSDCCMLFTAVPIADGILIAEEVLTWPNWKEMVDKLVTVGAQMDYPGVGKRTWFAKKIQCPLLADDKTCMVYERRPAACRFHAVRSDPKLCSPDAPDNVKTEIIYLLPLEESSWSVSKAFQEQYPEVLGDEFLVAAPIPLMVLFGMLMVGEKEHIDYIADKANSMKVLPPYPWLRKHGKGLMEEQEFEASSMSKQLEELGLPIPSIAVKDK